MKYYFRWNGAEGIRAIGKSGPLKKGDVMILGPKEADSVEGNDAYIKMTPEEVDEYLKQVEVTNEEAEAEHKRICEQAAKDVFGEDGPPKVEEPEGEGETPDSDPPIEEPPAITEDKPQRARDDEGKFEGDDPSTPAVNEAYDPPTEIAPEDRDYSALEDSELRALITERTGKAPGGRTKRENLIKTLTDLDANE